jgi:hypothetical protein
MLDAIQVLVQPIQDKREEFLRIMLVGPCELFRKVGDLFLNRPSVPAATGTPLGMCADLRGRRRAR